MAATKSDASEGVSTQEDRKREFVAGLRDLADCLERNPALNPPLGDSTVVGFHGDDARDAIIQAARLAGGKWDKTVTDDSFQLRRRFGPHTLLLFTARENVCERVVVGTETVTREEPDPGLLAQVPTVTVEETVERVQWVCPPSLLAAEATEL